MKELAPSKATASKTTFEALKILKQNGNKMLLKELLKEMENKVNFTDWEKERYEKSGYIRWQSILHFHTIGCVKAGYLIKKNRTWYLTNEGIEVLEKGEEKLFENILDGYKKWYKGHTITSNDTNADEAEIENNEEILIYSDLLEKALERMSVYINDKNPYEFQDLVAALLRGMGYYTPFIAPPGPDGGVDIIAYKDPLGTTTPRIKVQVKHREESASVKEIRELISLLRKDGDVGIFVSTGGFSKDAKAEVRSSNVHIELIDQDRFIELWKSFYNKLLDQDKKLFPLKSIYFLDLDI